MTNIWGFAVQTVEVSMLAAIILFLKTIMKDKLSPRWQYGVWRCLAVGIVTPVGSDNRYIFRYIQVYLQACKTLAEQKLSSAFTVADRVVYNTSVFPSITEHPLSITDWLFVIYTAGIVVLLAKYIISYFRLQSIIAKADKAPETTVHQVNSVAEKYSMKSCDTKVLSGVSSAFVFGIVKPVLVFPSIRETDDKVILHELLHLKHRDLWQKVIWSLLGILHWPNLFLQYCFGVINNDMESLRDQRALELLEGEDRREYGRILLSMTNEKYPSAFGTTSISNGAGFISERIKTIARFKKYPQGMGVVSVCIVLMMAPLLYRGRATPEKINHINLAKQGVSGQMQYEEYRMAQLATPAAAIDAYAKMITGCGEEAIKLAISPVGVEAGNYTLPDMDKIHLFGGDMLYFAVDFQKIDDNNYTAKLMLKDFYHGQDKEDYGTNYYMIPVTLVYQSGWKVYQSGDYAHHRLEGIMDNTFSPPTTDDYTGGVQVEYSTDYGAVKINADNISWNDEVDNNMYVYPYTQFSSSRLDIMTTFTMDKNCDSYSNIALTVAGLESIADYNNYDNEMAHYLGLDEISGSSTGDYGGYSFINVPMDRATTSYGRIIRNSLVRETEDFQLPQALQIDIWLGSDKVDSRVVNLKTGDVYDK